MKRVIAIANQKGGVGKTTTAVNLAASLTATKRRTLLIDLDPQGNATMGCGVDKNSQPRSSCDVLLGDCGVIEALAPVEHGGFMLMPSNQDVTAAEVRLLTMPVGREFKLRNALQTVKADFDVVLIDCPPALNMLTLNALVAADSVLVPMQCEYYALEGLSALMQTVDQIRESINPRLQLEGILRTMFDPRNNLANEVSAQLTEHFGDKVFRTIIPRNIRLAEAPSFGKPVLFHDKDSRGALAYLALAGELIRRDEAPGVDAPGVATPRKAPAKVPPAGDPPPAEQPVTEPPGNTMGDTPGADSPGQPPTTVPPAGDPPPAEPPVTEPPGNTMGDTLGADSPGQPPATVPPAGDPPPAEPPVTEPPGDTPGTDTPGIDTPPVEPPPQQGRAAETNLAAEIASHMHEPQLAPFNAESGAPAQTATEETAPTTGDGSHGAV